MTHTTGMEGEAASVTGQLEDDRNKGSHQDSQFRAADVPVASASVLRGEGPSKLFLPQTCWTLRQRGPTLPLARESISTAHS